MDKLRIAKGNLLHNVPNLLAQVISDSPTSRTADPPELPHPSQAPWGYFWVGQKEVDGSRQSASVKKCLREKNNGSMNCQSER